MEVTKSLFYFVIAGLCEIGGRYLVWLWLREGTSFGLAVVAAQISTKPDLNYSDPRNLENPVDSHF